MEEHGNLTEHGNLANGIEIEDARKQRMRKNLGKNAFQTARNQTLADICNGDQEKKWRRSYFGKATVAIARTLSSCPSNGDEKLKRIPLRLDK